MRAVAYDARVLKLRLPEQDSIKNEAERCSADPAMLASIGRAVGQQIRITRADDPGFVALYTVSEPNPDHPEQADVVRTGKAGRERLGTDAELTASVDARVLDAPPSPSEPPGVRFFELSDETGNAAYFIAIAPHGGKIEEQTDEQATAVAGYLRAARFAASLWLCKGFGDRAQGAADRWHITSTDLHPACFPLLQSLMSRRFLYGVAFHGFARQEDEADIYIGGGAPLRLKRRVECVLNRLQLPLEVKVSTRDDKSKFQGFSRQNIINRVAARGIHLEQSAKAREFHREIAEALAAVFASRWRWLVYRLMSFLIRARAQ
jgi:phage replication-related protein YjqB (UPF0714/DUF867 family)